MRHHSYNPDYKFFKEPVDFNMHSEKELLQYSLGATLYMPGTKQITDKILKKGMPEVTSIVMCFEDAIQEEDLESAEENVIDHLSTLSEEVDKGNVSIDDIPLTFLRVRNVSQFRAFAKKLNSNNSRLLSGFVFPKFYSNNASSYLDLLSSLREEINPYLYGMPILEGKSIAYKETRNGELTSLKHQLDPYEDLILNIRVGGTDFSALFGVRRGINYSIYDILTVRDCLSDILNFFNRSSDTFLVSGPVWEYFLAYIDDDIYNIDQEDIHKSILDRKPIINEAIDGLLREVILDKANGFVGKTIIHPSHAKFVNALQAVTREEYEDAEQILNTAGGVVKSAKANKMNEINPHRSWAKKIISRGRAYGVIDNDQSYLKLISNT